MAKFTTYNPAVEEALSAPIASMSNAISLMSDALNLGTTTLTDETMSEIYISDTDRYRIFAVDLNKRGWLETPAPVIKMNGTVITPTTNGFEINYLGGCINFLSESSRPTSSDVITASFTYVNGTSATIGDINTSITTLNTKTANYRGSFDSLTALESGVTNPLQYDYAYVFGAVSDIYFYDYTNSDWVSVTENDVAGLQTQINALDSGKENVIGTKNTAFNKNFGTGNEEVMRGDYAYSKSATDTAIATKEPIISDKGTAFNKDFGTEADTVMQGNNAYTKTVSDSKYEPIINKNTAFNKDFGTVTGTVAQGNYVAPSFTATTDFEDILTGETTITLFGKIKRWFTEIGNKFDKENILSYDELSAVTEEGEYVPDAVAFNKLNEDLGGFKPVIDDSTGQITGYKTGIGGADTVFPFSSKYKTLIQGDYVYGILQYNLNIICQSNCDSGFIVVSGASISSIKVTSNMNGEFDILETDSGLSSILYVIWFENIVENEVITIKSSTQARFNYLMYSD